MLFISLIGALASAQISGAAALPPADVSELNSMARTVRSFKAKDEFDTPPPQPTLTGRPFLLEVEPWGRTPPRMACFGYPSWSYDASSGTLYVSTGASELLLDSFRTQLGYITKRAERTIWPETVRYFATDCARAALAKYTATNAYGAKFEIEPTSQTVTAVADDVSGESALTRSFEIKMSGAQARSLVPNLRVRFRGALADWKPGSAVACGRKREGPIASSPYDRTLKACLFNGHIDRIELVDVRTGDVLQTASR